MHLDRKRAIVLVILVCGMVDLHGQQDLPDQKLMVQIQPGSSTHDVEALTKKLGATIDTKVPAINAIVMSVPTDHLDKAIADVKEGGLKCELQHLSRIRCRNVRKTFLPATAA